MRKHQNKSYRNELFSDTICQLANVIEWAKGNRGRKDINPYCVPEIRDALKHLARVFGKKDYLDVDTKEFCNKLDLE